MPIDGRSLRWVLIVASLVMTAGCRLGPEDNELIRASSRCQAEQVSRLLEAGWDPNEPDETGVAPMQAAAAGGFDATPEGSCVETMDVLFAAGGDPTKVYEGGSLVVDAVFASDPANVAWVVDHGADPCLPLPTVTTERYNVASLMELAAAEGAPGVEAAVADAINDHC